MHLTVRMAWHDNGWDGRVCLNPQANTYCSGAHSLLSGRIEKKKNVGLEQDKKGMVIAGEFLPDAVPPCYWSINAFGSKGFKVEHHHAFTTDTGPISTIADEVKPYSVFTWPFKLSFVHKQANQKKHGSYPRSGQAHRYFHSFVRAWAEYHFLETARSVQSYGLRSTYSL
jgi:exodeoxyribonuclease V alpha subunit